MTDREEERRTSSSEYPEALEVRCDSENQSQHHQQQSEEDGDAAAMVLAAVAQEAVNQMLVVPVSSSSSSSSLIGGGGEAGATSSSNDMAVATAAAAAAIALSAAAAQATTETISQDDSNNETSENVANKVMVMVNNTNNKTMNGFKLANVTDAKVHNANNLSNSLSSSNGGSPETKQAAHSLPSSNHCGPASGSLNSPVSQSTGKGSAGNVKNVSSLRRGKWTLEEEAYVARVIRDFNSGHLAAPAGTTLRTYLSEKLHCDPMRITKKFTGDSCIGKVCFCFLKMLVACLISLNIFHCLLILQRVFHPAVRTAANALVVDKAQTELKILEAKWRERLEAQHREASKKAGRHSLHHIGSPALSIASNNVTRTAAWLDQADMILRSTDPETTRNADKRDSVPHFTLEEQMENVKRLIHEGPLIRQNSNKLIPDNEPEERHIELSKRKVSDCAAEISSKDDDSQGMDSVVSVEDKRVRKSASGYNLSDCGNASDADAEALVGFLNAVRRERAFSQG